MTTTGLIKELAVSEKLTLTTATKAVRGLIRIISETVANNEGVTLKGFVSFKPMDVPERIARNPQTGEQVVVPAHKSVRIKLGSDFKIALQESKPISGMTDD